MNAAEGNIGFAKKLVSKEDFDRLEKMCLKVALSAANKDDYTIAKILTMLTKDELLELLPILSMFLRDIVVCKLSGGTNLVFKESVLQNKTNFDKIDINILYDCIKECEMAIELINSSVNVQLISAALVMRFCGGKRID